MSPFRALMIQVLKIGPEVRAAINARWINIVVATQIRGLRKKKGWSQTQLADASGVTVNTIIRLEKLWWPKNANPSLKTLSKIAAALDVALMARFIPWSEFVDQMESQQAGIGIPQSFSEDKLFHAADKLED